MDRKRKPIWDLMKTSNKELQEQKQRIEEKKAMLEELGYHLDTSHIKRSKDSEKLENRDDKMSMWDKMQLAERKILAEKEYLDRLERAYDDALEKISNEQQE